MFLIFQENFDSGLLAFIVFRQKSFNTIYKRLDSKYNFAFDMDETNLQTIPKILPYVHRQKGFIKPSDIRPLSKTTHQTKKIQIPTNLKFQEEEWNKQNIEKYQGKSRVSTNPLRIQYLLKMVLRNRTSYTSHEPPASLTSRHYVRQFAFYSSFLLPTNEFFRLKILNYCCI